LEDPVPINGRVAEQYAELALSGQGRIYVPHCSKELFVDRIVPDAADLCRVLPDLPERLIGDVVASDKSIHDLLILGISAFHDDVVDDGGEAWITNKRQAKGVALLVPVNALAKRHNSV